MKSKIVSALLSVLIAFGLWAYVITVESPGSSETYYDIPVAQVGESVLEERNLIITEISTTQVDLTLSGNRSDLSNVNSSNITLKADLSRIYEPGQHKIEYSISYPGNVASNAFTVENQSPKYITITVEKRVTRNIPVRIIYSGTLPDGFIFDKENAVLDATEITVSGPSSAMENIREAVINVDLSGREESLSEDYRFTLCDSKGEPVNAEWITVNTEKVHLDLKIEFSKDVPLVVTVIDGGGATAETSKIEITPKTISVSGSKAVLEELESINLGTINLAEVLKNTTEHYPITLPYGVNNMSQTAEAVVDITFPGLNTRNFDIEDIRIINVPEGMEAELIAQKITVSVRGPSAEMAKLTAQDIYVVIDFTDAKVGDTATYKAIVVISEKFPSVGAVGSHNVYASVAPAEEEE